MNETELLAILARGEDSRHQFKENISNVDSLAAEWVAFSNSGGGLFGRGRERRRRGGGVDRRRHQAAEPVVLQRGV